MRNGLMLLLFAGCSGAEEEKDAVIDDGPAQSECRDSCQRGTAIGCWMANVMCTTMAGRCQLDNDGCIVDPQSCAESCTQECGYDVLDASGDFAGCTSIKPPQ